MVLRYWAVVGVSELHRLENWVGGRDREAVLERSCASTRATRRREVVGLAPECQTKAISILVLLQAHKTDRFIIRSLTKRSQKAQPSRATSDADHIVDVL